MMVHIFNLFLALIIIHVINCNTKICPDDGLFENKGDRTAYFECTGGKSYFRRCPLSKDGLSYMLFDGKECVEAYPEKDAKTDEQEIDEEFTCPERTGVYSNPNNRHSYYKCVKFEPRLKLCPREKTAHLHGGHKHKRRMIWDGHQCVQVHRLSDRRSARHAKAVHPKPHVKFTCPSSDGRFPDPRDEHYYFICKNNVAERLNCPGDTVFSGGDGGQCLHPSVEVMVNDDPLAYQTQQGEPGEISCPPGTIYDPSTGMCRRDEFPNSIEHKGASTSKKQCPAGSVYDSSTGQCRREFLVDPVMNAEPAQPLVLQRVSCPKSYTYDEVLGRCVRVTLVDPVIKPAIVERQAPVCPPGYTYDGSRGGCYQITYFEPLNRRPETITCGAGQTFNAVRGICVEDVGRWRRNGRVEMEDAENGNVIVDSWNEQQYRWDRNPNGERKLNDINGWVVNLAHTRNNA